MWTVIGAVANGLIGVTVKQIKDRIQDNRVRRVVLRRILEPRVIQWRDEPETIEETARDVIRAIYDFSDATMWQALAYWLLTRTVLKGKVNVLSDFIKDYVKNNAKDLGNGRKLKALRDDMLTIL